MVAHKIQQFVFSWSVDRAVEESLAEVHADARAAADSGDVHTGADGGR